MSICDYISTKKSATYLTLQKQLSASTLLLATTNKHKLAEFQKLLQPLNRLGIKINSCSEKIQEFCVEETGLDFATNAAIKARACFQETKQLSLADDSGLAIDALDGRPGVHSARYGGEDLNSQQRCQLVLKELHGLSRAKRKAQFICVLAMCFGSKEEDIIFLRGEAKGYILEDMSGNQGFGYDPIFYDPKLKMSFAQMNFTQKNSRSHRAKAAKALVEFMVGFFDRIERAPRT